MWRIESGLVMSIFFNWQLTTIGLNPLIYKSLPHFPHTKKWHSSIHFKQCGKSLICDAFPYTHLLCSLELPKDPPICQLHDKKKIADIVLLYVSKIAFPASHRHEREFPFPYISQWECLEFPYPNSGIFFGVSCFCPKKRESFVVIPDPVPKHGNTIFLLPIPVLK